MTWVMTMLHVYQAGKTEIIVIAHCASDEFGLREYYEAGISDAHERYEI